MDRYWRVWNPKRLDALIAEAEPAHLFVCGNAANENSLRSRFECIEKAERETAADQREKCGDEGI